MTRDFRPEEAVVSEMVKAWSRQEIRGSIREMFEVC